MGRPLNKKWFGNLNTPAIGGEGLSSISVPNAVNTAVNATYTSFPTLVIPAPDLPGGVQATATVVWEIFNSTVAAGGTGYTAGLIDSTEIDAQASVAPKLYVEATDGVVTSLNFAIEGTNRGEFVTLNGTTAPWTLTDNSSGNDATLEFNFRVKSITITNPGAGYRTAPTLSWTAAEGQTAPAAPTATLAAAKGNAITAYAKTTSGGSNKIADIEKQVSSRRYKVTTADGTAVCTLVTDGVANAEGKMTITATDAKSNTYYVKKLTARRATLVRLTDTGTQGDWVYATDESAPWSFAAADGVYVQIANN